MGSLLGHGDSGDVYRAIDTLTGETVALKRLAPKLRIDAEIASRFAALSANAARIESPHVVHVRGIERGADGLPFLVLELVEGTDLARLIQASAPLPAARAIHFATQILDALRAAHAVGILHRRLCPSDCLVTEEATDPDVVKVINFGAGELLSELDAVSDSPAVRAALAYVAPEQIRNAHAATPQSDVYAVGAMLYEMLTRRRPFEADERNALILKICTEPPQPLLDLRPDLSPELCAAIEHALVKSPTGRAGSAVELAEVLLAVPEARSSEVSVSTRGRNDVDPMAATLSREALPIVPNVTVRAAPQPWIPPTAPASRPPRPPHHLVPHPDRWAIVVSAAVLLAVLWAIYAASRRSPQPTALPAMTIEEPIARPREPVSPKPVATSSETSATTPPPKPAPSAKPPKPPAKPSTTTIYLPPIVLPPIFSPPPKPGPSSTKPKIGGATGK